MADFPEAPAQEGPTEPADPLVLEGHVHLGLRLGLLLEEALIHLCNHLEKL
jgi:hypothetical protein